MISISCIFTNLYKVFFLNDFIDLKVFFRGWHKVGTHPAIYKGVFDDCALSDGVSGGLASGDRATPRKYCENQVSIRSAVA
jgi:hypothetical protein